MRTAKEKATEAVRKAKAHWGVAGWANLSEDMRQAYIAREVLKVIVGQDEEILAKNPVLGRLVEMALLALKEEA